MASTRGILQVGHITLPCALGRGGRKVLKREGDGATPVGNWKLRQLYYRPDRLNRPRQMLSAQALSRAAGWCDGVGDRNYNRAVSLPYPASHEEMWRSDALYDVVVTLDHNERPRVQGFGSAVFFHLAGSGFTPTAGCVALRREDMLRLLPLCGRRTRLTVWPVKP
jgi:L,D-peptidoglycan transpeptidase YkuD (ErfK/YbiS/YcfS/YnhG family)